MPEDRILVYYNPACSKCRGAKALLDERGLAYALRDYLAEPPDRAELEALRAALPESDRAALMRRKDPLVAELGLDAPDPGGDAALDAIARHPRLLERPIVVRGGRAVIARPPERLLELIDD